MELDHLDQLAASAFDGYLVRKDLVRRYSRQYPVPTYVVEFLLGRYCATVDEQEIEEGLQIVERQLQDRTVRTSEQELFKARAREKGSVKLIDIVKARLDSKTDSFLVELPSLGIKDVRIADTLVHEHERMLTDGFYAEVTLTYDAAIAEEKHGRPFAIESLRAIQLSKSDVLATLKKGRGQFTTAEWKDFLAPVRRPGAGGDVGSGEDGRAAADGPVRRAELQPGRTWPARHGEEPSVPADIALLAPDFGRQGDGRQDVREHVQRAARPGVPVRRGVLR